VIFSRSPSIHFSGTFTTIFAYLVDRSFEIDNDLLLGSGLVGSSSFRPAPVSGYQGIMARSTGDTTKPRKAPRPAVTGDPVMVRVQPDMAKLIDDRRRKQDDLPGRPEAIRRLLTIALKAKVK
jgi:hypothetical protein